MSAWGGISSVQFALPLMWTESKRRGFTLQDIIRLMSVGPAKLARLENRKGKIEVRPYIGGFHVCNFNSTVTPTPVKKSRQYFTFFLESFGISHTFDNYNHNEILLY